MLINASVSKRVFLFTIHSTSNTVVEFSTILKTQWYTDPAMNLEALNPQQRAAVEATTGPVLVLAGAGSGKTKVLTYRLAYILDQELATPEQILAVTFTNKAAGEMRERVEKLLSGNAKLPWMGTFHSICVRMLRRDGQAVGLNERFTIFDPQDQLDTTREAMEKLNISTKEVNPRAVHGLISSAKNELVSPAEYEQYAQGPFQRTVAAVYPVYQKLLREYNAVDFDDLLVLTVHLLRAQPEIRTKYQQLFRYVLVDEYQDTNHAQYLMIKMLSEKHRNICCVGDDDQSIYSFRGANIRNILNFKEDYPDALIIKLEQNYRSTQNILDAAHGVVSKNSNRTAKKLWTENPKGERLILYTASTEKDEALWVIRQAKDLVQQGVTPDEIAVLYRTNAQSRALEEACIQEALVYKVVGALRFYERREIKDILGYLRIIYNTQDDASLRRIINSPKRGIGPKALESLAVSAKAQGMSSVQYLLSGAEFAQRGLADFSRLLISLFQLSQEMNVADLMQRILEDSGYLSMLQDGSAEGEARIENLRELLSVAQKYEDYDPGSSLALFLEEVGLMEDNTQAQAGLAAVTLMTVHSAKGLEFEHVFLVGMEEGLFPHSRVFTAPDELEEERRLAYVAITRAKIKLYMVHTDSRMYFGARQQNLISRFVNDIAPQLLERKTGRATEWEEYSEVLTGWDSPQLPQLQVGDRVRHAQFGEGRVLSIDDYIVTVSFVGLHGKKELAKEFAPLQKI